MKRSSSALHADTCSHSLLQIKANCMPGVKTSCNPLSSLPRKLQRSTFQKANLQEEFGAPKQIIIEFVLLSWKMRPLVKKQFIRQVRVSTAALDCMRRMVQRLKPLKLLKKLYLNLKIRNLLILHVTEMEYLQLIKMLNFGPGAKTRTFNLVFQIVSILKESTSQWNSKLSMSLI